MRGFRLIAVVSVTLLFAACGSAVSHTGPAPRAARLAQWTPWVHVKRPLDVAGPRPHGSVVLAAAGRVWLLARSGTVTPFASAYTSPGGEEPYIALSPGGCFGRDQVYAIRLHSGRGVSAIGAGGQVRRFAALSAPGLIDGITFDRTGAFGHRLLVTINAGSRTTVDAIDCQGVVKEITRTAPRVEGGLAVAPRTFGRFAGDLIAPGEVSGKVFAITPAGATLLLASSGLPHGNDIGVESEGFVPAGAPREALVADRLTPGNRHPGDDVVLRIRAPVLHGAGVRAGDLLVATEGGALTDAIRCDAARCRVRRVAGGPAVAHLEGHIAFTNDP